MLPATGKPQHGLGPRIYVGRVLDEVSVQQVLAHFEVWGPVVDVYFPVLRQQGKRANYCFVTFADPTSLELALRDHGMHPSGKLIGVVSRAGDRQQPAALSKRSLPPSLTMFWQVLQELTTTPASLPGTALVTDCPLLAITAFCASGQLIAVVLQNLLTICRSSEQGSRNAAERIAQQLPLTLSLPSDTQFFCSILSACPRILSPSARFILLLYCCCTFRYLRNCASVAS